MIWTKSVEQNDGEQSFTECCPYSCEQFAGTRELSSILGSSIGAQSVYYRYGALVIMPNTLTETESDDEGDEISASARVNVIEILAEERSPPLTLRSETTHTKCDTTMAAVKFSVRVTVHRERCFACTRC
jgi:hypothetical protein